MTLAPVALPVQRFLLAKDTLFEDCKPLVARVHELLEFPQKSTKFELMLLHGGWYIEVREWKQDFESMFIPASWLDYEWWTVPGWENCIIFE